MQKFLTADASAPAPSRSTGSVTSFAFGRFVVLSVVLLFYAWALVDTYDFQIAGGNPGMLPLTISNVALVSGLLGLLLLAVLLAQVRGQPSDFFLIFYSAIVVVSYLSLHSLLGEVNEKDFLFFALIVISPLVVVKLFGAILPEFRCSGFVSPAFIQNAVIVIVIFAVIGGFLSAPSSVGFGIDDSHLRRLEGRDIYTAGSLLAYALSMSMNGFVPYLAYRSGVRFNLGLLVFSTLISIFFYWLIGVKAPMYYVAIAFSLGFLVKIRGLRFFGIFLLCMVLVLYVLVIFEWHLAADYSLIADYFFRRVFAVQAEVLSFYFHFLSNEKPLEWNWIIGAADPSFQVTYYIGRTYILNDDSNVNTNAFLYGLAAAGWLGYVFAVGFVSLFLAALDRLYKSTKNPAYIFIGFMYGLLLIEQAFTVAMVSSGVAVLFVLALVEKGEPAPIWRPLSGTLCSDGVGASGTSL